MISIAGKLASHRSKPVASTRVSMTRFGAVGGDDPVALDPLDAAGLQVHVRFGERAVVAVGHGGPLAAEVVIRGQLRRSSLSRIDRNRCILARSDAAMLSRREVTVVHAHVDDELVDGGR